MYMCWDCISIMNYDCICGFYLRTIIGLFVLFCNSILLFLYFLKSMVLENNNIVFNCIHDAKIAYIYIYMLEFDGNKHDVIMIAYVW